MRNETNEFSFILKPSTYGVGVFATHDIAKDTFLRLFGDEEKLENRAVLRKATDVPESFQEYCINRGDQLYAPKDFGCMPVGWYLNHSKKPNAVHRHYQWYAARDIVAGEETVIDYNTLEEPENARAPFYTS